MTQTYDAIGLQVFAVKSRSGIVDSLLFREAVWQPQTSKTTQQKSTLKSVMQKVYVVAAKRTPFGTFGGKLKDFTATELGAMAGQAAIK